jgi:AraC family transcriptional regulator
MTQRMSSPLTAASIAREVCVSRSHFAKLFRDEAGLAPYRYLKTLRLEYAKRLLRETNLTVKEVAATVGIADISHFVRDFKAHHGASPAEFRRQRTETQ